MLIFSAFDEFDKAMGICQTSCAGRDGRILFLGSTNDAISKHNSNKKLAEDQEKTNHKRPFQIFYNFVNK